MSRQYGTKPGVDPSLWRGVAFGVAVWAVFGLLLWGLT